MTRDHGNQREQRRGEGPARQPAPLQQYQEQFARSVEMLARETSRFQESMLGIFGVAQRQLTAFWGSSPSSERPASSPGGSRGAAPAATAVEQAASVQAASVVEDVTEEVAPAAAEAPEGAARAAGTAAQHDRPLEELSKEELYELSQRHEIEGRSAMNKDELLEAVARASRPLEERTKDELYGLAQEHEIEGRSGMNKDELVDALRPKVAAG